MTHQQRLETLTDLLINSATNGNYNMLVRLLTLLSLEVDPDINTILLGQLNITACRNGRATCASLLLSQGALTNHVDNRGFTALIEACFFGHTECVSILLDREADLNQVAKRGFTALIVSCQEGRPECASLLIDKGANINQVEDEGATALTIACQYGHYECTYLLVDKGADMNWVDNRGCTALMVACHKGHLACASLLLEMGAAIEQVDNRGASVLMLSCERGHHDCTCLLLAKGADVNFFNRFGMSALHCCIKKGHVRTTFHLLESGAAVTENHMLLAVMVNSVKCLALMLRSVGLEQIQINNSGGKLLRLARKLNSVENESFLLDNGASDDGSPWDCNKFLDAQEKLHEINKESKGERKQLRRCDYPDCDRDVPLEQLKKCKQCQEFWYCSKEHQQGHWKEHKAICNKLRL